MFLLKWSLNILQSTWDTLFKIYKKFRLLIVTFIINVEMLVKYENKTDIIQTTKTCNVASWTLECISWQKLIHNPDNNRIIWNAVTTKSEYCKYVIFKCLFFLLTIGDSPRILEIVLKGLTLYCMSGPFGLFCIFRARVITVVCLHVWSAFYWTCVCLYRSHPLCNLSVICYSCTWRMVHTREHIPSYCSVWRFVTTHLLLTNSLMNVSTSIFLQGFWILVPQKLFMEFTWY